MIDDKGRCTLPNRLRRQYDPGAVPLQEAMYNHWVFTYGYDRCIMGMPGSHWTRFVHEKIATLSRSVKENRKRIRFLMSGAYECDLDKQGRFILTTNLKDYADIHRETVMIGVGDYIEIWNPERLRSELPLSPEDIHHFANEFWS